MMDLAANSNSTILEYIFDRIITLITDLTVPVLYITCNTDL